MAEHYEFGAAAEKKAVGYLKSKKYDILATNWRYRKAEIDIIARFNDLIIIAEVKARQSSSTQFGVLPQDAVNLKKKRLLIEAANAFIEDRNLDYEVRFDIISVLHSKGNWEINHIENAFSAFEI